MKILSIETSCDETAISIVEANDKTPPPAGGGVKFSILGNALLSQVELHRQYGGVFPTLAKREHAKNLIPLLKQIIAGKGLSSRRNGAKRNDGRGQSLRSDELKEIKKILEREPELLAQFLKFIPTIEIPEIDVIAVTTGPGLEPALWVGINFAYALAIVWDKPIVPVNHMEGHIFSALLEERKENHKRHTNSKFQIPNIEFPTLALLISGGHTQLVLSRKFLEYEIIGETLDDAVGEAFDKVARMLGLPYPGGPEISILAEKVGRATSNRLDFKFPRPMLNSDTCDFSFSGLKTAVLYTLKKIPNLTDDIKQKVAKEFEDAVIEVLLAKTKKALIRHGAQMLVIGGGVSANKKIRKAFEKMLKNEFPEISLNMPLRELSTDNAIMIAVAGYFRFVQNPEKFKKQNIELRADGNLFLH